MRPPWEPGGFPAGVVWDRITPPEATEAIVASWLANADPPPGREVTDPFFAGAGLAWEQSSASAQAFFAAWLGGGLAR